MMKKITAPFLLMTFAIPACGTHDRNHRTPTEESFNIDGHGSTEDTDTPKNKTMGEYKGFHTITSNLRQRLLDPTKTGFEMRLYLDPNPKSLFGPNESVVDLLGYHNGDALRGGFVNGNPNAMSMLLWYMLSEAVAKDLLTICQSTTPPSTSIAYYLKESSSAALKEVCQSIATEDPSSALHKLWRLVANYDIQESEFQVLEQHVRDIPLAERQEHPLETLKEWLILVLMHPQFLLQ